MGVFFHLTYGRKAGCKWRSLRGTGGREGKVSSGTPLMYKISSLIKSSVLLHRCIFGIPYEYGI